jgi:ABC-2 type transport system ATP-binding protein
MVAMIQLDNVSVSYKLPNERIHSIKEYVIRCLKCKVNFHQFHALRDINLVVNEGEVLGILGHNGAGKSTMLKVIARVLRPTKGRVLLRGRVFPLLELGAGFDMELTGRENVYLNSAILGFSKADTRARFNRIVAFAGLEEFIDTPVRNYSTGMVSRLGFAIATDVQPEILIVDEVLSVGDAEFQQRSNERMQQFCKNGTTILLVTHNLKAMEKMCHRALWLDHGELKHIGLTQDVIAAYTSKQVADT